MIISVTTQKGGVGKTTIAANLAAGLQSKGHSALAIDLDAQRNLTQALTEKKDFTPSETTLSVLTGDTNINAAIFKTPNCDLIPAHKLLYTLDTIINPIGREKKLQKALKALKTKYEYIIIDTPPSLSTLTLNALNCCDYVLVPIKSDYFSLQAINDFYIDTFIPVKEELNKNIKLLGFVLTMYNGRTILSKTFLEQIKSTAGKINTRVFNATIRNSTLIGEAQAAAVNIFDYAPQANITEDFNNFIDELLTVINSSKRKGKTQ